MESKCNIRCNSKPIFFQISNVSFILLTLATILLGAIEIVQSSSERRNVITSVPHMYTDSNVSLSVLSTSVESLPRSIVVHPTVSYIDTESVQYIPDRGFTIPHFHIPDARLGPFFEEGTEPQNITAKLGSTVTLDCRIGLLHDKTVTWLHHKDDSIHLLTVGRNVYSSDARITLSFRYPNNWRLVIVYVTRRDEGLYECQVATHPPKVKRLFLKIIAPEVFLIDEVGREVTERYYKEGSTLELTCMGIQTEFINNSIERKITWTHGDQVLNKGISLNMSTEGYSIASTLTLSPVQKHNSGNYTCSINGLVSATVSIHVLNGESPAAIQLGNAVGRCERNINLFIYLLLLYYILR